MSGFKAAWDQLHPGFRPVGYLMREAGMEHWLRFHSLPDAKRYPDTNDEREILLNRQNQLGDEVFGKNVLCWLVQTCWEMPEGMVDLSAEHDPFWVCRNYDLTFAYRFLIDDDEDYAWNVFAASTTWNNGDFNDLLLRVADDESAPVSLVGASGAVFSPYDGGVDLFLPDRSEVEALKARHPSWLSRHPLGL